MAAAPSAMKNAAPAASVSDIKSTAKAAIGVEEADTAKADLPKSASKYAIVDDVPLVSGRVGPRLDKFPLADLAVGQSFLIPFVNRVIKGKHHQSPEAGFNLKQANAMFEGKKFMKKREAKGIRVGRIA